MGKEDRIHTFSRDKKYDNWRGRRGFLGLSIMLAATTLSGCLKGPVRNEDGIKPDSQVEPVLIAFSSSLEAIRQLKKRFDGPESRIYYGLEPDPRLYPRFFEQVRGINNVIAGFLEKGNSTLISANNWETVASGSVPESIELLTDIARGGIPEGRIEIIGFVDGIWQDRATNIPRTIIFVKRIIDNRYFALKFEHIEVAMDEVEGLRALGVVDGLNIHNPSVFRPNTAQKLVVSITEMVNDVNGAPAPMLADWIAAENTLTPEAKQVMTNMLRRFLDILHTASMSGEESVIPADILAHFANIIVDPDGKLHLIDSSAMKLKPGDIRFTRMNNGNVVVNVVNGPDINRTFENFKLLGIPVDDILREYDPTVISNVTPGTPFEIAFTDGSQSVTLALKNDSSTTVGTIFKVIRLPDWFDIGSLAKLSSEVLGLTTLLTIIADRLQVFGNAHIPSERKPRFSVNLAKLPGQINLEQLLAYSNFSVPLDEFKKMLKRSSEFDSLRLQFGFLPYERLHVKALIDSSGTEIPLLKQLTSVPIDLFDIYNMYPIPGNGGYLLDLELKNGNNYRLFLDFGAIVPIDYINQIDEILAQQPNVDKLITKLDAIKSYDPNFVILPDKEGRAYYMTLVQGPNGYEIVIRYLFVSEADNPNIQFPASLKPRVVKYNELETLLSLLDQNREVRETPIESML